MRIIVKGSDVCAREVLANFSTFFLSKNPESVAIKAIQSISGAKPHEPIVILDNGKNRILG
ncbi:MAG: hypothetical protein AAFQ83_09820 [Bacteroidota bacterium]